MERNALQNLRQRTGILVKPADKGSMVVVLRKADYIKEADQQLNGPQPSTCLRNRSFINSIFMRGQINENIKHKPGSPRRPIVYSNGGLTENILRFVDCFLDPLVTSLPSYIWNMTDLLNWLRRLPPLPSRNLCLASPPCIPSSLMKRE